MFLQPPGSIPWPTPLLNSPLAFVTLALIIAIAAYLRTAAENISRQIDDVLQGKPAIPYTPAQDIDRRIEALDHTRRWADRLALWVFMPLGVVTALRILAHAFSLVSLRMYYKLDLLNSWLRGVDLAITAALFVSISFLWWLYLSSVRHEEEFRGRMYKSRDKASQKSRVAD